MQSILFAILGLFLAASASAQGLSQPAATTQISGAIAVGNTFQVLSVAAAARRSLTIQNNNATDSCQLLVGGPWQAGVDTNIDLTLTPKGTGNVVAGGPLKLKSYTVATLPTCNSTTQDTMAVVTDATSPTYNGTLTGGGAVRIPVYCNGTAWTAH